MSEWIQKCWGRVRHVFNEDGFSFSELEVIAGQRSSIHFHRERANTFQVVDAEIIVETFKKVVFREDWIRQPFDPPDVAKCKASLLRIGDCFSIPSLIWHRFRTLRPGKVLELYYPDRGGTVRLDDIERFDKGGPDV